MKHRGWLSLLLVTWCVSAAAEPMKTLAGRWSASTARTSWSVEQWGDACGPRPNAESVPGGIVSISLRGNELVIDGLGRSYATTSCWENVSGQRVTSHAASARAWRTVCQSAPNDPRRATVTTTLTATDDRIDLAEVGQFEFAIEQQTCRATMRRSRAYALVEREGETRTAPPPAEAASQTPALDRAVTEPSSETRAGQHCREPGPPARLEVRPTRKLLRAGDEYSFHVRVLDRAGCSLERPLTWKVNASNTTLEVAPNGLIRVAKEASEGTATLTASIQDRTVQVTVDVVSEGRYQELLRAGSFDDRGETRDTAIATIASSSVGTKAAILEEKARTRRLVFVGVIGVIALGLAAAAIFMALGRRRQRRSTEGSDLDTDGLGVRSGAAGGGGPPTVDSAAPRATGDWLTCPTCHEEYPNGTKYCENDGNRLVPAGPHESAEGGVCPVCGQGFDPGVTVCPTHDEELVPPMVLATRQPAPMPTQRRICPVCGTIYDTGNQFCGNDGASLVPIN